MNNSIQSLDNKLTREEKVRLVKEYAELAKTDPITYIDRFFYTFDPRVQPNPHLRFRLFDYQKDITLELKNAMEQGYDIFLDKSRDVGATYTTLAVFLWFWRYIPGSNFLVGSRKEDYVDNRFGNRKEGELSNKEESLFGKMDYMVRKLPGFILPHGFDFKKHNGYMKLLNPENGNVIAGESSNPNFSRGGRYKAILLDEFAFWENDTAAWGSTADSTNCRIVLTTPGIKPGKAKRLRFSKDGEKIKVIEVDYKKDPRKTPQWEQKEQARRSTEDYAREILRNWDIAVKGRVYEEIMQAVLGNFPYKPDWPLYVAWDFGLDGTAIGWWQKNILNGKYRLVNSYFYENLPIQYAFPFFSHPIDSLFTYGQAELDLIEKVKLYKKAIHFGDPDVEKRAYQTRETTSTRKALQDKGIYVQTKPESNQFYIRREKTKVILQKGIEINKTPQNEYYLEAIQQARYPQRQEGSQATSAITLPVHDWTSHPRTMTEYLAVNVSNDEEVEVEEPEWAKSKPSWAR